MNILKLSRNVAMTLGFVVVAISSAQAVPILTFGQVGQANVVTATRVGANTSINATNAAVNITQIDAGGLVTPLAAFLTFDFDNLAPVVMLGPVITQRYAGTFCISEAADCGGDRYLFGDFEDITFGQGAALALAASTPPFTNVNFFSDVITNLDFHRGVGFSFANVTPALGETNGSINSFTSSVSGVFSANVGVVPEPETFALLMMGLVAVGLARRRPKSLD